MTNGNEPASPHGAWGQQTGTGLTKREYFAAIALTSIIGDERNYTVGYYAAMAVEASDALIEQLNKQK